MTAIRNCFRGLRLPPGLALAVLCVLFVCSQVVEVAHAEFDCEHVSCSLCIGPAGDNGLVGEAALAAAPRCRQWAESAVPASKRPGGTTQIHFIRGPPAT